MVNGWTSPFGQMSTSWWYSAWLFFIPTPVSSLCRGAGFQFAVGPWNCWRPTAQFCTGTAGVGICRRHHCSHQHRLFARRGFRGCQTELCQVQRDVARCMETSPRPSRPVWIGPNIYLYLVSCSFPRIIPWRRGRVVKVEKRLASWKVRSLSYQGKALILNALALSQIWNLCAVFSICQVGLRPD